MKVLIAMDSFKGNLSSLEVASIVEKGIKRVYNDAVIDKVAIADGGEGTVDALVESLNGKYVEPDVSNPIGQKISAKYGVVMGDTAVIEMASASGLCLIPESKRNPLYTSTFGTGEMISDALSKNCKRIILGIGGSATNDGGAGMAEALGVRFLDIKGNEIRRGGGELNKLSWIDISRINPAVKDTEFLAACDVSNVLYGENGASKIYGPQKGASPEIVEILDRNLHNYSEIIKKDLSKDIGMIPGSGAAGGLGAGLIAFCNAKLHKGIDIVMDLLNIEDRIKNADIVITGEGRIDGQTINGKVPVGVALRGKKYNKPVFAIAGFIDKGGNLVYEHGIDAVMSSMVGPLSLEAAISKSPALIEDAAERLFRIIHAVKNVK